MLVMPLLSGVVDFGLVADFGMGAVYSGTQASAGTSVTLTVYPDGSWIITFGSADTPSGTPTSGRWANGYGFNYEVQYTTAGETGSPNISNDASSYTPVTAPLGITVSKNLANALADVTVNIRRIGGSSAELTDTSQFQANGA